jgi:hypothetical protein
MSWLKDRYRREGAGRPAPASGWSRVGAMGLTHFWKLIRANLLFVLFSLPIVTLPAALTALDRVCVVIYRKGNIFLWEEFWKEFKKTSWYDCDCERMRKALSYALHKYQSKYGKIFA